MIASSLFFPQLENAKNVRGFENIRENRKARACVSDSWS